MKLRYILTLLINLILILTYGQGSGFNFIEGWTSSSSYQVDDSLLTVSIRNVIPGADGSGRHRVLLTKSTMDWSDSREVLFRYDSSHVTTHFNGSTINDHSLIVSGAFSPSLGIDTQTGYLAQFKLNGELLRKRSFHFGLVNQPYSVINTSEGNIALIGVYRSGPQNVRMFFLLVDSSLNTLDSNTYSCNDFNSYGGCNLSGYRIVETRDSNFIISASAYSRVYPEIRYSVVHKINTQGEILRSYKNKENVYSHEFPLVLSLNNDKHILFSLNNYFYPYKNPKYPDNRLPTTNLKMTTSKTEISGSGVEISKVDLKPEVAKFYSDDFEYNYLHCERAIKTKDGGYAICGHNSIDNEVGYEVGFLLKLDSLGTVSWFRRYQVDSSSPDNGLKQKTYVYGVSELDNGGFVMSGRYISPPSPEYPGAFNSALSIITDEYGCIEPGCQNKVSVDEIELSGFKVVPNPSNGIFRILGNSLTDIVSIKITTMNGQTIAHSEYRDVDAIEVSSYLGQGVYILTILKSNGEYDVSKLIISQ